MSVAVANCGSYWSALVKTGIPPEGASYQSTVSAPEFVTVTLNGGTISPRQMVGLFGFCGASGNTVQEHTGGSTVIVFTQPLAMAVMEIEVATEIPEKVNVPLPLLLGITKGVLVKLAVLEVTVT